MATLEGETSLPRPGFGYRHVSHQNVVFESGGSSSREAGLIPGLAVYMRRYTPGAMYMGGIYWIPHSVSIALSAAFGISSHGCNLTYLKYIE